MKPVFDENGLATVPGDMRCFYYNAVTYEYTGWSDEYINTGVSIPACSTGIDPGENIPGKVAVFTGKGWSHEEDHRNETVYSTENGAAVTVDYIGAIKDGYVTLSPLTPYDKWDGEKWVTDTEAQHSAAVEAAEAQRQSLIDAAMASISLILNGLRLRQFRPDDIRRGAGICCRHRVNVIQHSVKPGCFCLRQFPSGL